jgi:hypothetical protein
MSHALKISSPKELRTEPRKVFRCVARIVVAGMSPIGGRTIDISSNGISIMVPDHLRPNTLATIQLNAVIGNGIATLNVQARLIYSVCVGTKGFRSGFQFKDADALASKAIRSILQHQPDWQ